MITEDNVSAFLDGIIRCGIFFCLILSLIIATTACVNLINAEDETTCMERNCRHEYDMWVANSKKCAACFYDEEDVINNEEY